jgi:peptide/nickel transport system substrate-binding protein
MRRYQAGSWLLVERIGKRDLILYGFMVVILVSIWLAMFQIDRQWQFIAETQQKIDEQTRDIADLRRQIQRGVAVSAPVQGDGEALPASWRGFERAYRASQQSDYAQGDWLVFSFGSQVPTLTPFLSGDAYASRIQEWVLDTLATRDPETLEWLPLVAESWTEALDGLSITFKIRDGATFSDGEPVTAEDVAFSWRFLMDPKIAAPRERAYFSRVSDVTVDGSEVTFHFEEPYFLSFEMVATQLMILPEHFYGRYLESVEAAEQYNTSTGLLLGSGPYRMASPTDWKPGDLIELVRNERYWGWVSPPFERRIWKTISADAAQLTEFKNGGIDLYSATPLEYRDLLEDEGVQARSESYEYYNPRGGYIYIAWNTKRDDQPTFFADRRVREAMTYLTDRQRIVDEILLGYAMPANGPFNPLGRQADPDVVTRKFDLAKAKALLADAGFEDRDGDGVLESPDGQPLAFKLTYPSGSDAFKRVMLLLKDLYVRAGVLMEPDPVDWPVLIELLNTKNFDAVSLGWTGNFEIDVYQNLHSSQTDPGGDNFISYENPKLDALIEAARRELDEDKRMAIWHQVHQEIWRDQPYTYLFRAKALVFVDRRIQNVEVLRSGINQGGAWRMPLEWYVPSDLQKYTE